MTDDGRDATQILSLRRRLRLTQEQLARRLGTTVVQVHQWEHGYSRPGRAERARLRSVKPEAR